MAEKKTNLGNAAFFALKDIKKRLDELEFRIKELEFSKNYAIFKQRLDKLENDRPS